MKTINTKSPGDYGYIAMYGSRKVSLYAQSSYTAYEIAVRHFRASKQNKRFVTVTVCEKPDGTPVVHVADF